MGSTRQHGQVPSSSRERRQNKMPKDKEQVNPSAKAHSSKVTWALIANRPKVIALAVCLALGFIYVAVRGRALTSGGTRSSNLPAAFDSRIESNAQRMLEEGRRIFRY